MLANYIHYICMLSCICFRAFDPCSFSMLGEGTGVISFYFNYRLYTAQILLLLTYSWCNLCQFTSRTALLPALPMSQPYKKAARVKSNIHTCLCLSSFTYNLLLLLSPSSSTLLRVAQAKRRHIFYWTNPVSVDFCVGLAPSYSIMHPLSVRCPTLFSDAK